MRMRFPPSFLLSRYASLTVYSDVDDTLQCSHEHNGAGVDVQFPAKTIYPGAVAFELALSRGPLNLPAKPVVLLSARPKVKRKEVQKEGRMDDCLIALSCRLQ